MSWTGGAIVTPQHSASDVDVDVVVVGAGMAGIYAAYKFSSEGFSVQGFETGSDVGGVWFHNRYPGARVDVESLSYSYFFSEELYREWTWTEKLAGQPEILSYLGFVADRFDIRRLFHFGCRVTGATWDPDGRRYRIQSSGAAELTCRYLVMASGHLSEARKPNFAGLDDFGGRWLQTAHWPAEPVDVTGQRVAVIGTGSSGVQVVPPLARQAEHLYVFQRTANYGVPAQNGPMNAELHLQVSGAVRATYDGLVAGPTAMIAEPPTGPAHMFSAEERMALMQRRWELGGQNMNMVFTDQGTNLWANQLVGDFVRDKIRRIVENPEVASKLIPREYPIGTRRLAVNTGYYETFNRSNVTLVDIKADPIERITRTGIRTSRREFDVDVIVFAIGFEAFTGSIDAANIQNQAGHQPTDRWDRGPLTYLGIMTNGFPNLFFITGAGSPSVLANLFVQSVYHVNLLADICCHMRSHGYTTVEPTFAAEQAWSTHVDDVAKPLIRRDTVNYMMHVNRDDGSRVFIPYAAGMGDYADEVAGVVARGYEGFEFR